MVMVCKRCGCTVGLTTLRRTENGGIICSHCADRYYRRCNNCNNYIETSENRNVCVECDEIVYRRMCNSYSTKPIPRFQSKHKVKTQRYFGLEIELNYVSPDACHTIWDSLYKDKLIYNKSDGSISSGTEVVINPHDYNAIHKTLDRMKDGFEEVQHVRGFRENAGIHIHVSKNSISPFDLYKISYLFNYRMKPIDKRAIYYMSGRNDKSTSPTDYYSYCQLGTHSNKRKLTSPGERYIAVNLNNTDTIEYRIFKTTADVDEIKSYVEFTDKSIEYAHTHGIKNMNISSFLVWLKDNTDNKILKKKISNFERYNTKFVARNNVYVIPKHLLKGIKITSYKYLIDDLKKCESVTDVAEILDAYNKTPDRTNYYYPRERRTQNYGCGLELVKKLEHTLKAVLISKIIKGVQECA